MRRSPTLAAKANSELAGRLGKPCCPAYIALARGPGSRGRGVTLVRGKSGLHQARVAGNARRAKGAILRSRESATESKPPMAGDFFGRSTAQARVKGCGKSAPGCWQQRPHGKPHPEQDQIGVSRRSQNRQGCFAPRDPGWLLERARQRAAKMNGCRCRYGLLRDTVGGTEPGLQAPWHITRFRQSRTARR